MTGTTRKVSETIEERLQSEFKKFIGPMGMSVFLEMKSKELTKSNIFNYIDELLKDGVLKKENAIAFKQSVASIMGTSVSDEYDESRSIEQDTSINAKVLTGIMREEPAKGQKGFLTGIFGGKEK